MQERGERRGGPGELHINQLINNAKICGATPVYRVSMCVCGSGSGKLKQAAAAAAKVPLVPLSRRSLNGALPAGISAKFWLRRTPAAPYDTSKGTHTCECVCVCVCVLRCIRLAARAACNVRHVARFNGVAFKALQSQQLLPSRSHAIYI